MAGDLRLYRLDSLRFIAALWVALSHGLAFPLKQVAGESISPYIIGFYDCMFDGVAAVVVFFVISGLCIHLPYASGRTAFDLPSFLARRLIRIGLPLLTVYFIMAVVPGRVAGGTGAVLWSIYCEITYYVLYPALRIGFRKFGVFSFVVVSFVITASLIASDPMELYLWGFGRLTWLIGLPPWLLGCLLAEQVSRRSAGNGIVLWRVATFLVSASATILVFHGQPVKIGYPTTMTAFSLIAFFWIRKEISAVSASASLEWGGTWSYSIYLIHAMVLQAVKPLGSPLAAWIAAVPAVFIASYLFARLVEFPSHQFARFLSRRLSSRASITRDAIAR